MSSLRTFRRRLGFVFVVSILAGCAADLIPTSLDDRPSLNSTILDDALDDVVLTAGVEEPGELHIAVTTPFCCDPNVRIFEARFGDQDIVAQAFCYWDFNDGQSADGCRVRHRFNWEWEYSPKVTVTMADGATLDAEVRVAIGSAGSGAGSGNASPPLPGGGSTSGDASQSLVADAGEDVIVYEGALVELYGWATGDLTGEVSFFWRELTGADVVLDDPTSAKLSFEASLPVSQTRTLVFELTVTSGGLSATDIVSVTILAHSEDGVDGVQIQYLAGPEGDAEPGQYEVAWRFLDSLPKSDVRLIRGCCECQAFDSDVLTPDEEGVYTAAVEIPDDRSVWYFVRCALAGDPHATAAVHVNSPLSGTTVPPQSTVIWSFVGSRDEPESVAVALRSKLITHVAIFSGNRVTSDFLNAPQTREAIAVAKEAGVELILIRYLWQTQPSADTELSVLSDVDYYVREIDLARRDAVLIGAVYVGFDTETYGPTAIAAHFRAPDGFLEEDYHSLAATLAEVISQVGQVDFVLPAGSGRRNHPYTALAGLGKQRISESTYYDNERDIDSIPYSYELAGMHTNVVKDRSGRPTKPYFLPEEVFGNKSHIWKRKEGLMIWPREFRAGEVADLLSSFAGQCPANPDFQ